MPNRRDFLQQSIGLGASLLALPNYVSSRPQYAHSLKSISIVDTHVHFWELDRLEYPWLENKESPLSRDFIIADYQKATQDYTIEKIVFVESGRVPWQYLDETKWVHQLAKQDKRISGMVAYFPVDQGELARAELEELASYPLVRGIRSMGDVSEQLASAQYREGLRLLSDFNLSLDMHLGTKAFADFLPLIDQHPNTFFILNHLGLPNVKDGELESWKKGLKQLAERSNIYCKLSGLLTRCSSEQMNSNFLKPYIHTPLEYFGTDRVMFGSDWPVLTRADTFNSWMQLLEELTPDASQSELSQIFSETAKVAYRID